MTYEFVALERKAGIGTIVLNRPGVLNALNRQMYRELDEAITICETDDSVSVIIITGAGKRAFSAGADIHEMARIARESDGTADDPDRARRMWHLATCKKPTIGAINGLAYGGGAVVASSLDIRIGSENASFKFLAASYGRVNSTWNLPMQVGWPVAKELLFTARVVGAREASQIGLLNYVEASDKLMPKAIEVARQITDNDPRMVQGIKRLMISNVGTLWHEMHTNEDTAVSENLAPPPIEEGFSEFLEKREP